MSEDEMLDIIDRIIINNSLTYFGYNTVQVGYEALEKIVKQYKEQQKEIEEYNKRLTPTPDNYVPIEYQMIMYVDKKNYISKDKIREKIKEDEEFYREQDRMYEFNGKINLLQELLGEE